MSAECQCCCVSVVILVESQCFYVSVLSAECQCFCVSYMMALQLEREDRERKEVASRMQRRGVSELVESLTRRK